MKAIAVLLLLVLVACGGNGDEDEGLYPRDFQEADCMCH